MIIKKLFLPAITTLIIITNTQFASADKGLIFPPSNTLKNYQYPLETPVTPNFYRLPVTPPPYVFGQNNNQPRQQITPTPSQLQAFRNTPGQSQMIPNSRPSIAPRNLGNNNFTKNTGNNFPFSNTNMMPFGNKGNSGFNPFSNSNIPFSNGNGMMPTNPMNNMFGNNNGNNQNFNMPFFKSNNNRKKAWGDKRNIWPDFYTDFTDESWDTVMSGPRDLGRMPGGWRFPYISTPDPVTVSDAITNQFPPIAEEAGNMADFSKWGVFDSLKNQ